MRALVVLAALTINLTVFAESPPLILVSAETSIKPHSSVVCNLYLYNDSDKTLSVPSFETIAMVYSLHDVTEVRLPRGDSTALVTGHSSGVQSLKAHTIKQTQITVDLAAEPGDLVELYVEIGNEPNLRSNVVLLFCPIVGQVTEGAPKAARTPEKEK